MTVLELRQDRNDLGKRQQKTRADVGALIARYKTEAKPRQAPLAPKQDPALLGIYALIDGLRAGQAAIAREKEEQEIILQALRQEARQQSRTKLIAFGMYYLMAAILVGTFWAGAHG